MEEAAPDDAATLLHRLRLRGKVEVSGPVAADVVRRGWAVARGPRLALTPSGRVAAERAARIDDGSDEHAAVTRAYARFLPLNEELIRICSDWQVRPGGVENDHRDPHYDWSVLDRLGALDDRVGPVLRRVGDAVARFAGYRSRLGAARRHALAGEHDWVAGHRVDSYHTVWMELHEDLLLALGRTRDHEGAPA